MGSLKSRPRPFSMYRLFTAFLGVLDLCLPSRLVEIEMVSVTLVTNLRGSQSHGRLPCAHNGWLFLR